MATDLLSGLNSQQLEAVTADDGPVLVLAGPGSGKTRVLTHRIAYLIREMNVYPHHLMAVTFTNKAANEMRERVERILGGRLDGLQIGTFHAICARLLRREADHTPYGHDFLIYDTDDQQTVIKQALTELNVDTKKFNPGRVLHAISSAKNELIPPGAYAGRDYFGEIVGRVYPRYQQILLNSNALDFDDLLMQTYVLLRDHDEVREKYQRRYEYVLVDEFQDTNIAQYELVRTLAKPQNNVFVVGDEDQGIYAFRGADYRNVMRFRQDYLNPKVILLEQNYRSTQVVLDVARAVIDKNTQRTPKALFTDRQGGALVTVHEGYSETDEADFVARTIKDLYRTGGRDYNDIAVMYRTNAQSAALEEACRKQSIPYVLVGGIAFYRRREIRDLLAFMRLVHNPNDSVSFERIVNVPKRGIGDKTVDVLREWAARRNEGYGQTLDALVNGEPSPITGRAAGSMIAFWNMVKGWRKALDEGDLLVLFDQIMADTQYTFYAAEISDTDDQVNERRDNIAALRGLINEKKDWTLADFIAETALVADVDSLDETKNAVTLLTLHAAKGLEFPIVFITGLEDGLLPHFRSFDDPNGMAEERRLMYVGLTRAKDHLYLTYAFRRALYGDSRPGTSSRFLDDIPLNLTEGVSTKKKSDRERSAYQTMTTWERDEAPGPRARVGKSPKIIPFSSVQNAAPLKYRVGQRVRHAKFGEGVVIDSERHGQDEDVTIAFEDIGIKKLAASFANLVVLKD